MQRDKEFVALENKKTCMKKYKSGQIATASGQYEIIGSRGGRTGIEVTAVKGKPLPPTDKPKMSYILADKTKH